MKGLLLCFTICDISKGENYLCQDAGETETVRSNLCFTHKCKKERERETLIASRMQRRSLSSG